MAPPTLFRAVLLFALATATACFAGAPPTGFTETLVAGNLASPTAMAFAPDGRIFVCQQGGSLRVIKNGTLLAAPFVALTVNSSGERGLLGVAFDPNFTTNQFVYVYYTKPTPVLRNVISRFTANGDVALAGSEVILLDLNPLSGATNHNGGALHFGLDGKLYIAVGDNAAPSNSQTLANLLGKVLRMNPDGSIPTDNPFYGTATGFNRLIWAYGLRNPFTFAVQPGTGTIFINDVGQNTWEEINAGRAGANYGWPTTEGTTSNPAFDSPLFSYPHGGAQPSGCAIAGGGFYSPPTATFPASYVGLYFFADLCSGWIYTIHPSTRATTQFLTGASNPVDIRTGADGSLYYLQRGGGSNTGEVRRIDYTSTTGPSITTHPASQTVTAGQPVTFTVAANGQNLSYQWQRNTVNIPNATQASYTLNPTALTDTGAIFRVVVSNSGGSVTSDPATLTVTANRPPTATITLPAAGSLFSGGDTIGFSGTGNDPDTGALPTQNLTWYVNYVTGLNSPNGPVVRPFLGPVTGSSGSFTVPVRTPYTLPDVLYRISLTARDPQGLETTVTRDVLPRVATLTLVTSPPGLQVTLDGQPASGAIQSVVGLQRDLGTTSIQGGGTTRRVFSSWSDGGQQNHTIFVPIVDTTYTAQFRTQNLLTRAVSPAAGGTLTVIPPSADGFYDATVTIELHATPNAGWTFTGFTGDLGSPLSPGNLTMSAPRTVTANFTPVVVNNHVTDLRFVPVAPCRLMDTRAGQGTAGAFGPPTLGAGATRTLPIPSGRCGAFTGANAYSLNITVVPARTLSYLTIWPNGQPQPLVSTLNSFQGEVVANAAIVPAGADGSVNVFVTDASDVIVDVNGYFTTPLVQDGLQFYPVTPCRIADTRAGSGKTAFGAPRIETAGTRTFPVLTSSCGIPSRAQAYSLNATVIPSGALGYLTLWPAGSSPRPPVSTLNSFAGAVVANAAIVPAGVDGAINAYASDATDLVLDINGYFAPQGPGGLDFATVTPCRIADTRQTTGFLGPFGAPALGPGATRTMTLPAGGCGIPTGAYAYSLNVTVVPSGPLGYLTAWPAGQPLPLASTLNSFRGFVVANAALVPAVTDGAISFFVTDATHLVVDINGYFRPSILASGQ